MCELKATDQIHFGQIPQAQFVAEPPDQDLENDVGREFQKIEHGSGAFVEGPVAPPACKAQITGRCRLGQSKGVSGNGNMGRPWGSNYPTRSANAQNES